MDIILSPLIEVIMMAIRLYVWVIVVQAIMSWLIAFQVINTHNSIVNRIGYTLYRLTEPILGRIRNILPSFGSIDLSPIVLLLALWFLEGVLARFAATLY